MARRDDIISKTKKKKDSMSLYGEKLNLLVNDIVMSCTENLTKLMFTIKNYLKQPDLISDSVLENLILDLANELYFVGLEVEKLGIQEDVCKSIRQEAYALSRQGFSGTVADRNNMADRAVQSETLVQCVYSRSYKSVKIALDSGYEMLNSLKKIMNRRIAELELSNSRYIGGSVND